MTTAQPDQAAATQAPMYMSVGTCTQVHLAGFFGTEASTPNPLFALYPKEHATLATARQISPIRALCGCLCGAVAVLRIQGAASWYAATQPAWCLFERYETYWGRGRGQTQPKNSYILGCRCFLWCWWGSAVAPLSDLYVWSGLTDTHMAHLVS
jgi:hypothetical protein